MLYIRCIRQHISVIIIIIAVQTVYIYQRAAAEAEQSVLVFHPRLCKQFPCFVRRYGPLADGKCCSDDLSHTLIKLIKKVPVNLQSALGAYIIAVSDSKLHLDLLRLIMAQHVIYSFNHYQYGSTHISFMSAGTLKGYEAYLSILFDRLLKLPYPSVFKDQAYTCILAVLKVRSHLLVCGACGILFFFSVDFYRNHIHIM